MVRSSPYVTDFEKGLVYLFQFPRMKVVPSGSPYCLKLETWLRMADIPYKNVEGLPMTIRSKEGTLPFIELDGKEYDDSEFIIRELTVLFNKQSMEAHLNDHDKAAARGIEKLAVLELLPISAKSRLPYVDEILRLMPDPGMIRYIMFPIFKRYFRNRVEGALTATGVGKHPDEEIQKMGETDLLAISHFLGTKQYMTGSTPTELDASVFAAVGLILYMGFDTAERRFIEEKVPNIKAYCDRIKEKYWPDWDEATQNFTLNTEWIKNRLPAAKQ